MGTTPLWVPLAVALIAVIGTLAGVIFTQIWNSRLEERRWAREQSRLREAQAREDLNRTYEHRKAAYIDFLQEFERLRSLYSHTNREPIPFDDPVYDELLQRWTVIHLYGTHEAHQLAFLCLDILEAWGTRPHDAAMEPNLNQAADNFVRQIRKELGVPELKPVESLGSETVTGQHKRDHGR